MILKIYGKLSTLNCPANNVDRYWRRQLWLKRVYIVNNQYCCEIEGLLLLMEKSPSSYHRNNTLLVEVINCGKIVVVKILGEKL